MKILFLSLVLVLVSSAGAIPTGKGANEGRKVSFVATEAPDNPHFRKQVGKVWTNNFSNENGHVESEIHPQFFSAILSVDPDFGRHSCFDPRCIRFHGGRAHTHSHGDSFIPPVIPPIVLPVVPPVTVPPVVIPPIDPPEETQKVPDTGSTFGILGVALLGFVVFRRKFKMGA